MYNIVAVIKEQRYTTFSEGGITLLLCYSYSVIHASVSDIEYCSILHFLYILLKVIVLFLCLVILWLYGSF